MTVMFACEHCDRSYQSRSSLARHLRNHSIDHSRLVCPTCDVAFTRRDLLTRHMRIHHLTQTEGRFNSSRESRDASEKAIPRRRVHTACQSCRAARVKCDGEQPCVPCKVNKRDCLYNSPNNRVSRMGGSVTDHGVSPFGTEKAACKRAGTLVSETAGLPSSSFPITPIELPSRSTGTVSQSNISDPMNLDTGDAGTGFEFCDMGSMDSLGLFWPADSFPEPISWPWMHESLYLQGDPCDDLFAAAAVNTAAFSDSSGPHPIDSRSQTVSNGSRMDVSYPNDDAATLLISPHDSSSAQDDHPVEFPTRPSTSTLPSESQRRDQDSSSYRSRSEAQKQTAAEMVAYATRPEPEPPSSRLCYWWSMSIRVAEAFRIEDWRADSSQPTLLRLMALYEKHFSPLWPLLRTIDYDAATLHPLLFLVLVSIGAMYGTPQECCFGAVIHEEIRHILVTALFQMEEDERNMLPLAQARLLTQVAALYFGQRRAFSYAQHLGVVLIAQSRRMDLFSNSRMHYPITSMLKKEQFTAWCAIEARKRLAFGILRVDVFTSVLMNTRPLLCSEEIDFDLPSPDDIWTSAGQVSMDELLERIKAHSPQGARLPFCDLVWIALDRSEALLEMEPARYELLLFGLQEAVWRFSHDPHLFRRLAGSCELPVSLRTMGGLRHASLGTSPVGRRQSSVQTDQLGVVHRRMTDLQDQRLQLIEALGKWDRSFTAVRTAAGSLPASRTSILSSLLLFSLSFLRLAAPLADLHGVAQALSCKHTVDKRRLYQLTSWAHGEDALVAVDSACQIWELLAHETERPVGDRAKHNLLAFAGLHHAAVVLWVFAGCHLEPVLDLKLPGLGDEAPTPICRPESGRIIRRILYLYRQLVPIGWCSFAAAAEHLSRNIFPAQILNHSADKQTEC